MFTCQFSLILYAFINVHFQDVNVFAFYLAISFAASGFIL